MTKYDIRYVGDTLAGVCDFDELRYQKKKEVRRGTRAGSIGIYCANEAVADSGLDWANVDRDRGRRLHRRHRARQRRDRERNLRDQGFDYDTKFWSHHHNPRTVANNPAGEITLNMGITGPHYTIGAACAAGNAGLIQGAQMLRLGECDVALAGGVSESIHTFGIFAGFASQGALADARRSRPRPRGRSTWTATASSSPKAAACTCSSGFDDAKRRGAKIYGELVGYAMNSDASDFVLPNPERQAECMELALERAGLDAERHRHRQHARHRHRPAATSRSAQALRQVFGDGDADARQQHQELHRPRDGRRRGAGAGRQSAGVRRRRVPRDDQRRSSSTPSAHLPGLVLNEPRERKRVDYILNNSFGMLGINSVVIIGKSCNVAASMSHATRRPRQLTYDGEPRHDPR